MYASSAISSLPKTSQEHDNYCFPLILVLISEVTAHCGGLVLSILVRLTQKLVKRNRNGDNLPLKSEKIIKLLTDCVVGSVL